MGILNAMDILTPFTETSSWFYNDLNTVASQLVSRILTEAL